MEVTGSFAEARAAHSGRVGVVPTMGFLHEGHLSLLEAARRDNDVVIMTLYVNPLQFDEGSDLARYPRDLERDLGLAREAGVDVVFAPPEEVMFAEEPDTTVRLPALTARMEGVHRPGHFEGVSTVVAKLFAGLQPDRAYFGRKDAQQLAIVRRMVHDLSFPIEIVGRPIVRESDGLALSSRNVFLDDEARAAALALNRSLQVASDAIGAGERKGSRIEDAARAVLDAGDGVDLEYVELAAQSDVAHLEALDRSAFLAVAARAGGVRLIDNIHIDAGPDGFAVDHGSRLARPSILYGRS